MNDAQKLQRAVVGQKQVLKHCLIEAKVLSIDDADELLEALADLIIALINKHRPVAQGDAG